jgi:O-antigen ligase
VIESIVVCAVLRRWPSWPLAAATMLLAGLAAAGELGGRILQSAPFQYRREMAQSALVMIAERPWSGFGLGTFETVYPAYARFDNGAVVEHAHDDWLEWASEGGLPFSAVWVFLALSALRPAVRSVWGLGVPAIFLHALVDYPFARFGVTAWVFALIGALAGEESATNPTKPV